MLLAITAIFEPEEHEAEIVSPDPEKTVCVGVPFGSDQKSFSTR